jgi:anti-sigma B factor antagonist
MRENAVRVDVVQTEGLMVVKPAGERLDLEAAGAFRLAMLRLIRAGHHRLVVDLAEVELIDSAGLRTLVSSLRTLRMSERAGEIRLANVRPPVMTLLEIIRLDQVFATYPSVAEAVHSFCEDAP